MFSFAARDLAPYSDDAVAMAAMGASTSDEAIKAVKAAIEALKVGEG